MAADPEAPADPTRHLRMLPVVTVSDPALLDVIRAGAHRAGRGAQVVVLEEAGEDAIVRARDSGAEVVISLGGQMSSLRALNVVRELGGRGLPVLGLVTDADLALVSAATLALLSNPHLRDVNVPVPAVDEDGDRRRLWDQLRASRIEDRHHLVEVDGGPALEELQERGQTAPHDRWAGLAAGAAGVLAGRMAASNRRWRRQLDG